MLTFDQMKELVRLVAGSQVGSLEVRQGDFVFRVGTPAEAAQAPSRVASMASEVASAPVEAPAGEEDSPEPEGHLLCSPIVGTFYAAPSPDAEPYVRVGDRVRQGQVLCIVEAMKLMNEIESDVDGVVLKVFPENAHPVEFGEPLFCIETD